MPVEYSELFKIDPKILNKLVSVYLAKKYSKDKTRSLRDIAVLLARIGILTKNGKPYAATAISRLLKVNLSEKDIEIAELCEDYSRENLLETYILENAGVDTYHWITSERRLRRRECFRFLNE